MATAHTEEKAAEQAAEKSQTEQVRVQVPVCTKCGSAERTNYHHVIEREIHGKLIKWARCECQQCGQRMVHRFEGPLPAK